MSSTDTSETTEEMKQLNIDKSSNTFLTREDLNTINSLKSEDKPEDHNIVAKYTKWEDCDCQVTFGGLDNDSICSEDPEKMPPIPDGGYGWVVVASAFLIAACADGLAFTFGLLQEEFTTYFDTTQSKTSLVGSLFVATPLLAGPFMSALVDRYGCRSMSIIAGVLSTLGFLLASISNSVGMLCLTFGFMSGLAMGILYVTSVVSIAFWFDKRRNLAFSLAASGVGFGTLLYSPMTHYFLEIYDWRNTIVLLAGTLLQMSVCGVLMRDPEWLKVKQKRDRKMSKSRKSSSAGSVSSKSIGGESVFMSTKELKSLLKSGKSPEYILATLATSIAEAEQLEATTQMNAEQSFKRLHSAIHLPTFVQQNEEVPSEVIEKLIANKRLYNIILENYPDILNTRRHSEEKLAETRHDPDTAKVSVNVKVKKPKKPGSKSSMTKLEIEERNPNLKAPETANNKTRDDQKKVKTKKDNSTIVQRNADWFKTQISTDHHYFRDVPLYKNTFMHRVAMMNIPRYRLRGASLPNIYRNSMWSLSTVSDDGLSCYERFWETIKTIFDFRMLTEFHFVMFNISSLILSVWFIVPYFFLSSYMTEQNMEGGPTMTSIIGISSSVGIIALGWSGDQPWINVTKLYAACLIICGLSVSAYPLFITSYWALACVSTVFGLSSASSYSLMAAILMELMPIDYFTVAYGLLLLSQGIGQLGGPPLAGMLYDITGNWDLTFYVGGLWLVVSGMCIGVIAYTKDARLCGTGPLLKETEDKIEKEKEDV